MANTHLVSFSLLFLAAALFAGVAHGVDICQKAGSDKIALCRSVVKNVADPREATIIAINHLITQTKLAKETSAKYRKSQTVGVCKENYSFALDSLLQSLASLKSGDKASLNTNLSASMSSYGTCDDTILEMNEFIDGKANLMRTDAMLKQLASNCLALASLT